MERTDSRINVKSLVSQALPICASSSDTSALANRMIEKKKAQPLYHFSTTNEPIGNVLNTNILLESVFHLLCLDERLPRRFLRSEEGSSVRINYLQSFHSAGFLLGCLSEIAISFLAGESRNAINAYNGLRNTGQFGKNIIFPGQ